MKILKLTIENFLTIGHAVIELDRRGLVLVQGENEDDTSATSNGAGKSSILNALCWGLYGITSNGLKSDAVVNRKMGKNCRVMVTIDDEGEQYSIIRHRKHKEGKHRVQVFSTDGELTRGTDTLTDAMVVKLIGSTKDVFLASVYASQENMTSLPDMSDKLLKAIVEESAGVDRLTRAYDIACKRYNAVTPKLTAAESFLASRISLNASLTTDIDDLNGRVFEWAEEKEARVASIETEAKANIDKIRAQLALVKSQDGDDDFAAKAAKLNKVLDSVDVKVKAKTKLVEARSLLLALENSKHDEIDREKSAAKKHLMNAKAVGDQVGTPCSECGKNYCEADLSHVKDSHKKNAIERIGQSKKLEADLVAIAADIVEIDAKIVTAKAEIPDVTKIVAALNQLNTNKLNAQHEMDKLEPLKTEHVRLTNAADTIKKEENPYLDQVARKEKALGVCMAETKEAEITLNKIKQVQANLDAVKMVYSPKGVRNHILSSVTPFLNERTAHYLNTLSDGAIEAVWQTVELTKKGDARDKFGIAVTHKMGGDCFAALSGGEKRKVRLSTTLALQDLVASRASKSIDLFCGDEIDDALDSAGLERLMGILEAKARERGTVMIISHNELKSWVSEFITIVKRDGVSTVE